MSQQLASAREEKRTIFELLNTDRVRDAFKQVATQYMGPEKMLRLCINAIRRTPKLAECDPQSVLGSMMFLQSIGLEPNTPQGHAYLIPYKSRRQVNGQWAEYYECQLIIGYKGYIQLAYRNPNLLKLVAKPIYGSDKFEHQEGSESFLKHIPALTDRGPLIGAYAYAKFKTEHGEADVATILPIDEIHKIRAKSETFRYLSNNVERARSQTDAQKAEQKLQETPWVMWEGEMAAKSALRRQIKIMPLEGALAVAATLEDRMEGGEVLDMAPVSNPDVAQAVAAGEEEPQAVEHPGGESSEPAKQQARQQSRRQSSAARKKAEARQEEQPRFTVGNKGDVVDHETGEIVPPEFVKHFEDGGFSVLKAYHERDRKDHPASGGEAGERQVPPPSGGGASEPESRQSPDATTDKEASGPPKQLFGADG